MSWNVRGSWIISSPQTLLPVSFNSRLVIKISEIAGLRSTWLWAGFFYQYLDLPFDANGGLIRTSKKIHVPTTDLFLFTPEKYQPDYQLKFTKVDWIDSLILTIYEDPMPIYGTPDNIIFPSTKTSSAVSTTTAPATTSTQLLAANANRKKVLIANNTNQIMILELGATASLASATLTLPAKTAGGQIYVFEDNQYTGIISAIAAAAASGAWNVREFS